MITPIGTVMRVDPSWSRAGLVVCLHNSRQAVGSRYYGRALFRAASDGRRQGGVQAAAKKLVEKSG